MSRTMQSLLRIPYWAYLLVILVIVVNTIYLIFRYQIPEDGVFIEFRNNKCVITTVIPGSPADKAGLRAGDIIKAQNSKPVTPDLFTYYYLRTGDTIKYLLQREGREFTAQCVCESRRKDMGFLVGIYILILSVSMGSLYILHKKPGDPAARIFFIYIQLFAITSNAGHIQFQDPFATFANVAFLVSGCLFGGTLIHFYLLFPKRASIYTRFRFLPVPCYAAGFLVSVLYTVIYIRMIYRPAVENANRFMVVDHYVVLWITITYFIALMVAVYQYLTIKNTLARNQIRLVIIGSLFAFITPMTFAFFPEWIFQIGYEYILEIYQAIGSIIMIILLLFAIFRYRIWDVEVLIRKTLLYLGATAIIISNYLFLLWIIDRLIIRETNLTRFLILAFSVIVFLVLRDRIQYLVDRFFHRESYDSATVVSDFEAKLAGIYRFDVLNRTIARELNDIFHFKSFAFILKKNDRVYEPVFAFGDDGLAEMKESEITHELEEKLRRSKVFSPAELSRGHPLLEAVNGEVIVPLVSGNQPNGFFVCGQKKSERIYSQQDIRVLLLLARRVIAMLHTAGLYQKDLERQLMLERERARISRDMHDDIGAGLTKIAMISEAPVSASDQGEEIRNRLERVAFSSREMISRLNVIVWALNPKDDNLASLVAYIRRYFGEYLENSGILLKTVFPDNIPDHTITPDKRRNIFYALNEAIHNAVKHAACTEIGIEVAISGITMQAAVSDNGKGFEQAKPGSGGNGLLNMKKRAEELGGSVQVDSVPGRGTRVIFTFRLR
jgi:signal transduction histidine kinase